MFYIDHLKLFIFVFTLITIASYSYIRIYKKFNLKSSVPTGFGVFLPIILLLSYLLFDFANITNLLSSLITILLFTLFYYIDDLYHLSPKTRIIMTAITSLCLSIFSLNNPLFEIINNKFILISIVVILLSSILVNCLNFYDGADLNLTSLIFLAGLTLIFLDIDKSTNTFIGTTLLAFSLSFSLFNFRKSTLYLGDTGSFSFSILIIFLFIPYLIYNKSAPFILINLFSFPLFDFFYVLLIRYRFKHNFLTRNYLHLYQRLQIKYNNFSYLLPPLLNYIISLLLLYCLHLYHLPYVMSIIFISTIFTPSFYLLIRKRFLPSSYFFGDGT